MSMFQFGRFLRRAFTAAGAFGVVMQVVRPEWLIQLAGGQVMRPHAWAWEVPDPSLVTAVSSQINWSATYGPAIGMAVCTYIWWRSTGRLESLEAARLAQEAIAPSAARG